MISEDFFVSIHDAFRLEWKFNYNFLKDNKNVTKYRIQTWFSIPRSLGILEDTYNKEKFYNDLQHYLRLKTPYVPLKDFLSSNDNIFNEWKKAVLSGDEEKIINMTRILGNIFKTACRDEPEKRINRLAFILKEASLRFKLLPLNVPEFAEKIKSSESIRYTYERTAKYISLLTEKTCFKILEKKSSHKKELVDLISQEETWLKKNFKDIKKTPEEFLLDFSGLKKEIASSLFLHVRRFDITKVSENIVVALSAAIAMALFTIFSYFANWKFVPYSTPFFLIIIIGYVFKDRLKDLINSYIKKEFFRTSFDHEIIIRGPDRLATPMGTLKESVFFTSTDHIPQKLKSVYENNLLPLSQFLKDIVISYVREVTLYSKRLHKAYPFFSGVVDILRWNVNNILTRMDDPESKVWRLKQKRVFSIKTLRLYPVIIGISVLYNKTQIFFKVYNLFLNRNGIVKLEEYKL